MSSQDCFPLPILLLAVSHPVLFITVDLARRAGRSGAATVAAPAKNNLAPVGGFSAGQVRLLLHRLFWRLFSRRHDSLHGSPLIGSMHEIQRKQP